MPNQFLSPEGDLENYFVDEYWLIDQYVGDTLLSWGQNDSGQLGLNNITTPITNPQETSTKGVNWKQVSCGYVHTAAIKTDGTLWTWGLNSYGRLGDGTVAQKNAPTVISSSATTWKQVAGGRFHTAAVKIDGTLWTWGRNHFGQLGNGSAGATNTLSPTQTVVVGTNWKQVSCGYGHTAAIKTDGTLWSWGQNAYRQLGDNTNTQRTSPVQEFNPSTNWKQVACGQYHTTAIKTDGTLWAWGFNSQGQIGDGTSGINRTIPTSISGGGTNWKQVACGQYHTSAIKTDGTLWTWGRNNEGQLGINLSGSGNDRSTPVQTFLGGTNWKQVACGYYHTVAIKTDGTVWAWGRNDFGQLGLNNTTSFSILIPTEVYGEATNWKQVSSGGFHTSAVTSGTDATYFIS